MIDVGVLDPEIYIYVYTGPGVQSEGMKQFEGLTLSRKFVLVSEKVSFDHKGP